MTLPFYPSSGSPTSLKEALSQVTSRRVVNKAIRKYGATYLLEAVARETGQTEDELLQQGAELLGMEVISDLQVPTRELIEMTGYTEKLLRNASILPQSCQRGYFLAVSDPKTIVTSAFHSLGIGLCLVSSHRIDEMWKTRSVAIANVEDESLFEMYRNYTRKPVECHVVSPGDILSPCLRSQQG